MAADGSVIIDVRLDKKSAIADLNALEAQIKRTTQKIGSIEKSLSSATTKRNNLRDDLEAARQKAKETAQALEEVNARLDAGHHSKYGVVSEADVALSDKLSAQYEDQMTIFGVPGSVVIQRYYTGSSEPSSSTGSNGDLYLQTGG